MRRYSEAVEADVRKKMSEPEALYANANAVLSMAEQRDLEKRHQQDQKEIKQLKQDLRRKEKALAEAAALLIAAKKNPGLLWRGRGGLTTPDDRQKALEIREEGIAAGARANELDPTPQRRGTPKDPAHLKRAPIRLIAARPNCA